MTALSPHITSLSGSEPANPPWFAETKARLEGELTAKHGEACRARLAAGLRQVAQLWRAQDGDAAAFETFVREHFIGDPAALETVLNRFEGLIEHLAGRLNRVSLEFRAQVDLDRGPILPVDELFAGYDPGAHVVADWFDNKLAFAVLLNFPVKTLDECEREGKSWSRRQWAEVRLAQRFSKRVPGEINLEIARALAEASQYIAEYNIWMHHLVDDKGNRLFPPKLRLLSHWNLRDQIKADYLNKENGLARQRQIQLVMERIVNQTIPAAVVNNPHLDWNPVSNEVKPAAVRDSGEAAPATLAASNAPEPDTRYQKLLAVFQAARKADPYSPATPTVIARRFDEERQIPEPRVRQMFEQLLGSPSRARVGRLIAARLGRPLEPFDIWYNGFAPAGDHSEAKLDTLVRQKYPDAEAYRRDMPRLLEKLGFSSERSAWLAENIDVDPARGSGHAWGAAMRSEKAHLRTRVEKDGMNYKGYNIAVHEMGHNVEQTFSLKAVDRYLLQGVPNNAATEAFAFVFQGRDFELLGLPGPGPEARSLKVLNDFWATCEIAAVGLVDMEVWHWMYDHPDASAAELKAATVQIAQGIWNKFFASIFQKRDVPLLAIYSHMIDSLLYLPDYPIGHLVAHQIEEHLAKKGNWGAELERMARIGNLTPDLWMEQATGSRIGSEALLGAAERALTSFAGSSN